MSKSLKTFSQQKWLRAYLWRAATVLTIWAVLFAVLAGKEKEQDRRVAGLIAAIDDREIAIRDIDGRLAEQHERWKARLDGFYREPGRSSNDCPPWAKSREDECAQLLGERSKAEARIARLQSYLAAARTDGGRTFARWLAIAVVAGLVAVGTFYVPLRKSRASRT